MLERDVGLSSLPTIEVHIEPDTGPEAGRIVHMAVLDAATCRLTIGGSFGPETFQTEILDGDVIEALRRYESVELGVVSLLRIGACATLAASMDIDLQLVRHELDRAVNDASQAVSDLRCHIREMVGADGPLANTMNKVSTELADVLRAVLDKQADPTQPSTLLSQITSVTERIEKLLAWAQAQIAEEVRRTADRQAETLAQTARALRDADGSGPLAQSLSRMEKMLADITTGLAVNQARTVERNLSTAKGRAYEDIATAHIASVAAACGDRAEHTGNQPGILMGSRGPSKRGDVVSIINSSGLADDLRIVLEIMDRDPKDLTGKAVVSELQEAMQNRRAQAAIAVIASVENPLLCGQPIAVLADNLWAVALSPETPELLPLRVTYRICRQWVISASRRGKSADTATLQRGIEDIARKLKLLDDARNQVLAIGTCQKKAFTSLCDFEKDVKASIDVLLQRVVGPDRSAA